MRGNYVGLSSITCPTLVGILIDNFIFPFNLIDRRRERESCWEIAKETFLFRDIEPLKDRGSREFRFHDTFGM